MGTITRNGLYRFFSTALLKRMEEEARVFVHGLPSSFGRMEDLVNIRKELTNREIAQIKLNKNKMNFLQESG